jgi:hypothetical protein
MALLNPHSPESVNADVSLFTSTKPAFPTPVSTEESPRWPPYSLAADELTPEQIRVSWLLLEVFIRATAAYTSDGITSVS